MYNLLTNQTNEQPKMNANTNNLKCGVCGETDEDYWTRDGVAHCEKCNTKWCENWTAEDEAEDDEDAYNPLEGLTTRQILRIFRIRANRNLRKDIAEAKQALATPSNLVEMSSYQAFKLSLNIPSILGEGEKEVPAVCYECGVEGKMLCVEGEEDEDWLCLDCSSC